MGNMISNASTQAERANDDICWTTNDLQNLEILLKIGRIGAEQATKALSQVLQEPIKVEIPRLHMAPPHLVTSIYGKHDTVVSAIFMQLRGVADCDIMLIFNVEEAEKIAGMLAGNASDDLVDPAMEVSAIEEIGSIMICSFLSVMANFAGTGLFPTPPRLVKDSFDAIVDGLIAKQALCSDMAAVFDARFKRYHSSAEGFFVMFPSKELQELLTRKGKNRPGEANAGIA